MRIDSMKPAMCMSLAAWILAAGASAGAQCPPDTLLRTLFNPAPAELDHFGYSVAVSGNFAVVGANQDSPGGVNGAGTAYVFDATTGALIATLDNPDPAADDRFGFSVAVSGNIAVVGAYRDDPGGIFDAGTAWVFDATTGALVATLSNPVPVAYDNFGVSVAVSDNTAVVGATWKSLSGGWGSGTAWVFNAATGALVATLDNPAPEIGDNFGVSVAVSGNIAVVGAYWDDPGGMTNAGTAYVFDKTTGALVATLNNPAPSSGDEFGQSVSISGNVAIVGAHGDNPRGQDAVGTAYVFNATTGALVATLSNPAPTDPAYDRFGYSVAVSGNTAVVGAYSAGAGEYNYYPGRAYIFNATTGALVATLDKPAPLGYNEHFGWSVAVSGDTAIVGAHWDNPGGGYGGEGTAYVFKCSDLVPTPTPAPSPTASTTPAATATPSPTAPGASPTAPPCCPGDADNSGSFVDGLDFIAVQASFGVDNGAGGPGDADCSGSFIDANDFIAVQANFGADCG